MKTVLVTGVSRGIGKATAQRLLEAGFAVVGTSRQPHCIDINESRFTALQLDLETIVNDERQMQVFIEQSRAVDALILNAGAGRFGGLETFSHQQINQLMSVNLIAQIQLTRAFLKTFKKRGCGDFIFIGSEAALAGAKQGTIYCAAKFGLRGFAQALRKECQGRNVRVGIINPGMVMSAFFDELSFAPGADSANSVLPGQVADAVLLMLNSAPNVVFDEINLSPLKKVILKK